jgi:DNA-binding XRE family transcriptional regulator
MDKNKQKRLEAAGWRIGSAAEFLGLSPDEETYVEIRLRLADGLKERRAQSNMTQTALAKAIRSSQSRIAKMEAGDPTVTLDLLIRTILALGASERDVARMITKTSPRVASSA